MTRTAVITITCFNDEAPQGAVVCQSQITPSLKPGETSLVAQAAGTVKRIMQRANNSERLENALDSCPACDDPLIREDM